MSTRTKKFVFCADLHLDDGAWTTRPAIYGDAYYSFAQIVDYCIAEQLPLILGGDVLERKQNLARPVALLCNGLSRAEANNIPVYFIQGNHEYDRNMPWLNVHPWADHMHEKTVDIGGLSVYGLDWLPRGDIQEAFTKIPEGTDVLITHQVWQDFMQKIGRTECDLNDVHNTDLVLSGDFHVTKSVKSTNAQGREIVMYSPGSTCMQDMGESPDKYFLVIGVDDTQRIFVEEQPLKTRKLIKHSVTTQDELDNLCAGALADEITAAVEAARADWVPGDIETPLVRVKFAKELPDAYLRVATAVGTRAHLFCEALAQKTKKDTQQTERKLKTDLLSVVAELTKGDPAAYDFAFKLLTAVDPAREIDILMNEIDADGNEATDATIKT